MADCIFFLRQKFLLDHKENASNVIIFENCTQIYFENSNNKTLLPEFSNLLHIVTDKC